MAKILVFLILLPTLIISTVSTSYVDGGTPLASAPSSISFQPNSHTYTPSLISTILSTLGFQEISSAAAAANLTTTNLITIFAPSDSSLLTCPSCSLPLLLQELSLPGLYPLHFLRTLIFGTKIETLAANRCLTVTGDDKDKVFVNGVEVTQPDLFNNGFVIVHGLQGFISHLSPVSCDIERMSSLSFPSPSLSTSAVSTTSQAIMRLMLKDAVLRLRTNGYSVSSLALRVKFLHLLELKYMTVFALDDISIFSGEGNSYLSNFRFHVVPNKRLTGSELVSLPSSTLLPTMDEGNNLVITTAGGGGSLAPMRLNYVKIRTIDLLHNSRIVVHGVSSAFPHVHNSYEAYAQKREGSYRSNCDQFEEKIGMCKAESAMPAVVQSSIDAEGRHGL